MKRLITLILAVVMIFSLSSCNNNADIMTTDLSKPITLNWIMPGPGVQTDSEKVWSKFNEELHKIEGFENVTVNIEVIPIADYAQKFLLMQTSGEPMDIVQTYTLDYAKEFRNGSFMDMTSYLPLLKEASKDIPEWVVDMGKVDGAQAIVPNYQKMTEAPWAITMPKDLADEYADVEAMKIAIQESDYTLPETLQPVEDYLEKVYEAGKIGTGYVGVNTKGYENIIGRFGYRRYEDDVRITHSELEKDIAVDVWNVSREFFKKGYIRKDVLSAKPADKNGVKDGNVLWMSQIWNGTEIYVDENTYDFPVVQVPISNSFFVPYKPAAGGFAIHTDSKYPDVAMKVINLMMSSEYKELYNLMVYGIEGEHYEVVKELDGDKVIKPFDYVEEGNSSARYGLNKWIVGNAKNAYLTYNLDENFKKFVYEYMNEGENTTVSKLMGFALDQNSIETKLMQLNTVQGEYKALSSGAIDIEGKYNEYITKLEAAGVYDIIGEIQRQVDEHLKNK